MFFLSTVCIDECVLLCFPFFVFSPVCVLHLPGHHGEELGEVDRAVAVGVNLGDNVEESLSLFNV